MSVVRICLLTAAVCLVCSVLYCQPAGEAPAFPGTLVRANGRKTEFTNLMGLRETADGYEGVEGKLVLNENVPEEIPLQKVAKIKWDATGKTATVHYLDGSKKTSSVFVGICIVTANTPTSRLRTAYLLKRSGAI